MAHATKVPETLGNAARRACTVSKSVPLVAWEKGKVSVASGVSHTFQISAVIFNCCVTVGLDFFTCETELRTLFRSCFRMK